MLSACYNCDDGERWRLKNDSDYLIEMKAYRNEELVFESEVLYPNGYAELPYQPGAEDPLQTLDLDVYATILVYFDTLKVVEISEIGDPYLYDESNCEKKSSNRCCERTFYITNEHYEQSLIVD